MIRRTTFIQSLADSADPALVGGKAMNLGRVIRAGFPVPPGFVVTTDAFRAAQRESQNDLPAVVADEIRSAYRDMGGGVVAVRSSATAEDLAHASMAGQYETFLDVEGEADLIESVQRCWASLDSPRTRAYLREHGIDVARVGMAVAVQRLVPADAAGVLFTANPNNPAGGEMLLEASWGLGEAVVSGLVQPDVLRLDRETGRVIAASIADKQVCIPAGAREHRPVEESRRKAPCLSGRDVHRLWQLGRRVAQHFGSPQDIEWAIQGDEVFLIQSRPITTGQEILATERILRDAKSHLSADCAGGRGPWVLHNLAETLPHPTPLAWNVIQRFMSPIGGFGEMYRQAGFEPSLKLGPEGFLHLICGQIYMDVSRAPEMFFESFPFSYDVNHLREDPDASQSPPTVPRASWLAQRQAERRLRSVDATLRKLSETLDAKLCNEVFLEIAAYVASAKAIDLRSLTAEWLLELWKEHEKLVMDTFAPQLLLPSLICGMAMQDLRQFLREALWQENADELAQLISSGGEPDRTILSDFALYRVGKGELSLGAWLEGHGHRAAGEFDLAAPRWRERPEQVRDMAARLAAGASPQARHQLNSERVAREIDAIRSKLPGADRAEFDQRIGLLRRYHPFREDGKDFFMLGYDLLRDLAREAGRRLQIGDDVFFLTQREMFESVRVDYAPLHIIEQRKIEHSAEAKLQLPRLIDSAEIESLGTQPKPAANSGGHRALPVSAGEATGPARVLKSPTEAGEIGRGYILVCPSTDPSWTPLFVNAAALVLECGGTLSHGAVVAREMGLPAVVLPDATRIFKDGQEICVDGTRGWAGGASDRNAAAAPIIEQSQIEKIPPPGRKDRAAARARNSCALAWTAYLLAMLLLPQRWVYQPTLWAMDQLLWPIVRFAGKPGAVAIIATGIALLTLLIQRFATDNARLLEAKRRAAKLKATADAMPADAPERIELLHMVNSVQLRTLLAAMVPVGILLGPMVMPFIWLGKRVDPSTWNAPPGSAVQIVASLDADFSRSVRIDVPDFVTIDEATPASRTLPPLRKTLERLLVLYRQPRNESNQPWELQSAPDPGRQQMADDLQAYLDAGIPPQGITWTIHPRADQTGSFPVSVTAVGYPPVTVRVVLGDSHPPAPLVVAGAIDSAVKQVRVAYPGSATERSFWRPLPKLAAFDVGWVGLYILVYLPALLVVKRVLRVA